MADKKENKDGVGKMLGKPKKVILNVAGNVKKIADSKLNEFRERQNKNRIDLNKKKREKELKDLSPIFLYDLTRDSLQRERLIRIVNYDRRLEKEICKNSVGFYEYTKDRRIPAIYTRYIKELGLSFYPQLSESVYLADPCIAGKYIEINEYYNYMKQVRVNELTMIAQSLGAKHVKIAYTGANSSTYSDSLNINANVKNKFKDDSKRAKKKKNDDENTLAKIDASRKNERSQNSNIEIWADTYFKVGIWNGGPVMPTVLYFRNESDISSLIQMTLRNDSKITQRTYRLKASSSSGIALTEAASIEGALSAIKCNVGGDFERHAKTESNSVLEYTIEF